jgi:hypothetical protein
MFKGVRYDYQIVIYGHVTCHISTYSIISIYNSQNLHCLCQATVTVTTIVLVVLQQVIINNFFCIWSVTVFITTGIHRCLGVYSLKFNKLIILHQKNSIILFTQ